MREVIRKNTPSSILKKKIGKLLCWYLRTKKNRTSEGDQYSFNFIFLTDLKLLLKLILKKLHSTYVTEEHMYKEHLGSALIFHPYKVCFKSRKIHKACNQQ